VLFAQRFGFSFDFGVQNRCQEANRQVKLEFAPLGLQRDNVGHGGEPARGMIARQDDERCQLMPKSTSRRTSLQPVFEPFDLLEDAPLMPPAPTNGYHSEVLPDNDSTSCNGHRCNVRDASINGTSAHDHPGDDIDCGLDPGETMFNGAMFEGATFGLSDVDPDLADLAAAKAAFAADPISESPLPNLTSDIASLNGSSNSSDAVSPSDPTNESDTPSPSDSASQNGHPILNGHADLFGDAKLNGHSESNGAMIAAPSDSAVESPASPPISDVPPIVGDEAVQPPAVASTESPAEDVSAPLSATRETHPASGSLFVPYLVTEIRELRNRRPRRSWWRRIFG
jgi:hypothetical protein